MKLPLFPSAKTNTLTKAFLINALLVSLISVTAVETKRQLDHKREFNETIRVLITLLITFGSALFWYVILWGLLDFGGGMLDLT